MGSCELFEAIADLPLSGLPDRRYECGTSFDGVEQGGVVGVIQFLLDNGALDLVHEWVVDQFLVLRQGEEYGGRFLQVQVAVDLLLV